MAIVSVLRITSIFVHIFFILSPMASSISESEALLNFKKSLTNTEALDSWNPGSDPCAKDKAWVGLVCFNANVTGLRLAKMGLSGKIDVDALIQLSGLRTLSLVNNSFSGPIPEFNKIGALKGIYLSGNQFSGEIPWNYFAKMESLKKVWLSYNNFTGEIPLSLAQLPNLISLHLEHNQFSGAIPLLEQPNLESLNLSNNNLKGEIPSSLSKFSAGSFEGNDGLCGEKLGKYCNQTVVPNSNKSPSSSAKSNSSSENHNNSKMISVGLMMAFVVIFGLMTLGIIVLRRRQERSEEVESENNLDNEVINDVDLTPRPSGMGGSSHKGGPSSNVKGIGDMVLINDDKGVFGLADLMKAAAEVLGNGTLGSSYKATMANGLEVVVKRVKDMRRMGKDRFDAEMRRFGRLRHPNVLTPLAYHYRKEEKLMIYEYIPKGSLHNLLHGDHGPCHAELNWPTRLKIIQGIARGLTYIHTELSFLDLPHGDLKSSNVLLSPDYDPLIADYGFSALVNSNQAPQALFAYQSPEAAQHHHVSPKCDVYCLGIIILETLTGKFPSQYLNNSNGGTDVVHWVKLEIFEGREAELFDPDIARSRNAQGEMLRLLHIGVACVESNPEQRLDINEAVRRIEEIKIEGGQEEDHVLPSLRDGYVDASGSQLSLVSMERRHNSLGDQSTRTNSSDCFSFEIS